MKTYPYSTGVPLPVVKQHGFKKLFLFFLFIALTFISFAQGGSGSSTLQFKNATLVSGEAGSVGAVYKFPSINSEVDALVTIKARSNSLVYLVNIDMVTSGFDKAWQPQVGYNNGTAPGAADWWMEFEMSFVQKQTSTLAVVDSFALSAIDIDGNGHLIREYVSFYGLSSYILEANSLLTTLDLTGLVGGLNKLIGKRFDGPTVNFTNIDTSGTSVMTTAKYIATQKFTMRVGGVATGESGASERMYSLYFQNFKYNQPQQATLPVKLKSFDAKLASNKAMLNWTSETELNFSHYIVEKSNDGKNYSNLSLVFANSEKGNTVSYAYTEQLTGSDAGLLYYRLKMVDIDGAFKYSNVRILKLNTSANVSFTTYPNPVVSELRVTIPNEWQDQKVAYDMYNTSGKLVKRVVNARASQTETIYMSDVDAGVYVIRLSSGSSTASHQIVKSR